MNNAETLPNESHLNLPSAFLPEKYHKESIWHRNWKKAFPESYREKSFSCPITGELHRADVFTPCGTAIEFQNSPIGLAEMQSRESFYKQLVWVLNGKKFKGFRILKNLPHPEDPRLGDYEFCNTDHLSMIRKAEILSGVAKPKILNFYHPALKGISFNSNYYHFCWKQAHVVWSFAKAPIVVDLDGHFLYQVRVREQVSGNYSYLELINRKHFIAKYLSY